MSFPIFMPSINIIRRGHFTGLLISFALDTSFLDKFIWEYRVLKT